MTILCIETSTSVCSAAICKDGAPIKQCICLEGSNHARLLPRYIEELLSFAREKQLSIDAVALSEGPGSYTGLRIGTSTAKGLCYGLDIPLIPVSTLAVLCEAAKAQSPITNHQSAILVPMIDARRMEVYTTDGGEKARAVVVENEESVLSQQAQPAVCTLSAEGGLAAERSYFYFGDGAAKCQSVLTSPNWHFLPGIVPEAKYMGGLAENQKSKVESQIISGQKLAYYEPYYLKEFVAAQSHVKGLNS